MTANNLCFYGSFIDKEYLPSLKNCVGGATCFVRLEKITTLTEVKMYCASREITGIISTSIPLLMKLLKWTEKKAPSLANYAGSVFRLDTGKEDGSYIEIVFVHPLKHTFTVPYGKFLLRRYVSKLVRKGEWMQKIPFSWSLCTPESFESDLAALQTSFLTSIDIETFKESAQIRCVAFCGFYYTPDGHISAHAVVLPIDSPYALALLRKLCWEVKAPKVFQNGKYDNNYLLRYSAPVYNYVYDTANMFHCWYSELPKDLAAINSFFVRDSMYWKDMAHTDDLQEYYHYNALDTYATGCCAIAWMLEAPKWAKENYLLEFPTVFPCVLAEMTGIARDMDRLELARKEQQDLDDSLVASLRNVLGEPNFNPGSPKQVVQLLKLLGCKDITSSDEKSLTKAKFRHPFNGRVLGYIAKSRKARKLLTTYLTTEDKAKEFHRLDGTGNRILYALNPHGTDTSRLASKEHHFWTGLQIQNIPRGKLVKQTLVADPGFYLAEVDLEQAESRDTAYISGEEKLIEAVEGTRDFHAHNVEAFFGVAYDKIYDDVNKVVIDKKLRDIGKRVNHGANYNMGWSVLIDTMGEEKIILARNLLGLPKVWSLKEVAEFLLEGFHKTYPKIRETMYKGIVAEIGSTKMLSSKALHHVRPLDEEALYRVEDEYEGAIKVYPSWTRYCFGDPTKSKMTLNSYVAHPPQSLNAQTLNKAWIKVFHTIAINPIHADNFKLCAQVHDSILFQYRIGHEYLCDMVKDCMEIPITIKAYDGKIRTFTVPAGVKRGLINKETGELVPAKYWSETE